MKGRKMGAIAASAVLLTLGLTACGSNQSAGTSAKDGKANGPAMVLKLADNQAPDYPTVLGDNEFAKLVKERSNGRIEIKVYPSAQLGDEKSVIEQVQLGAINFARINSAPLAEFSKDISVFNLPYLFDSSDQMWKVLNGPIGEKLLKSLVL